jgi:hypothetical protein
VWSTGYGSPMTQHTGSPTRTYRAALGLASLVTGLLALTVATSAPAQASAVCTTDLDCAAWELQRAAYTGADISEDLSFEPGFVVYEDGSVASGEPMSELYAAKNDLLADAFWSAHAGEDWDTAQEHVGEWVEAYRAG